MKLDHDPVAKNQLLEYFGVIHNTEKSLVMLVSLVDIIIELGSSGYKIQFYNDTSTACKCGCGCNHYIEVTVLDSDGNKLVEGIGYSVPVLEVAIECVHKLFEKKLLEN